MSEQVTDKYAFLRENLQVLVAEAASKGGYNPRSKMIIDLLADYDALHAEAEALRDENERLREHVPKAQLHALEMGQKALELARDLEAARGLLRLVCERFRPRTDLQGETILRIRDFLTATPAPEVRCQTFDGTGDVHRADGEWLGECHCVKAEQGERQGAVAPDALRKRFSEIEDEVARGEHNAMSCFTAMRTAALYTSQPGPDVRALVETLEQIIRKADDRTAMTDADYRTLSSVVAEEALAAHRQAQQGGIHGT